MSDRVAQQGYSPWKRTHLSIYQPINISVNMMELYDRAHRRKINRLWLSILLVVSWTRKMIIPPALVRAWEFGLARQFRPSRPVSSCSFFTPRLNLSIVLTHGIPPAFRGDGRSHTYYVDNRHRVSPALVRPRNCKPMAFTAESPPAKGL